MPSGSVSTNPVPTDGIHHTPPHVGCCSRGYPHYMAVTYVSVVSVCGSSLVPFVFVVVSRRRNPNDTEHTPSFWPDIGHRLTDHWRLVLGALSHDRTGSVVPTPRLTLCTNPSPWFLQKLPCPRYSMTLSPRRAPQPVIRKLVSQEPSTSPAPRFPYFAALPCHCRQLPARSDMGFVQKVGD